MRIICFFSSVFFSVFSVTLWLVSSLGSSRLCVRLFLTHLFLRRRCQFLEVLLRITIIRLSGGGHAFLGEAQRLGPLAQRQHGLGGRAAIAEIGGHALDQTAKHF